MSAPYEIRTNDNGRSKKQSMAELKLRRLNELNQRLQEDLNRRRIPVSEAAIDLIAFTEKEPKDFMVPSRWGTVDKRDDPYAPQQSGGCCVMIRFFGLPLFNNDCRCYLKAALECGRLSTAWPRVVFCNGIGRFVRGLHFTSMKAVRRVVTMTEAALNADGEWCDCERSQGPFSNARAITRSSPHHRGKATMKLCAYNGNVRDPKARDKRGIRGTHMETDNSTSRAGPHPGQGRG
ncbi:hypothetical protein M8818_006279 [Zalaria obscura]|uniref:Uncharacterized protein n=1 Tax=Zalaria obscura TaxID=2024903 RepID=A0ACC3SAL4_9PEZI